MPVPRKAGFYWAVWLTPSPGTREGTELAPSSEWEVVYVFENGVSAHDREYLRVLVTGVEQSQSLENFRWGGWPALAMSAKTRRASFCTASRFSRSAPSSSSPIRMSKK